LTGVALSVASVAIGAMVSVSASGSTLPVGARSTSPGIMYRHHGHGDVRNGVQSSVNWSGYAQNGPTGAYSSTTATWRVPTAKSTYDGDTSSWIGIDGAQNQYLIQTGTDVDVTNGRVSYDAWYEVITPNNLAPSVEFSRFAVHPGDMITGTITRGASNKWTMTLKNGTTGAVATVTVSYSGPGQSVEFIEEDPVLGSDITPSPDFGWVAFTGLTANGANPNLTYSDSIDIVDGQGTQEDVTSYPYGGNSFYIFWLAAGTPTRY
jgi:hypothetical protein